MADPIVEELMQPIAAFIANENRPTKDTLSVLERVQDELDGWITHIKDHNEVRSWLTTR